MKRRNFAIASGSAILTGTFAPLQYQQPAVGLDFKLSGIPDKNPNNVDILTINFEKLEITPQYLDDSRDIKVRAELELENYGKDGSSLDSVPVTNGDTKQLSERVDPMVVEDINADSTVSGVVNVTVEHSNIQNTYSQLFAITGTKVPANGISESWTQVGSANFKQERDINYAPFNSNFTVDIEVDENDNHNPDESVRVELGIRMKDADGNTTDELSTKVEFGGGTNFDTKTNTNTGNLEAGESWVYFIDCDPAPSTTFSPNQMDVDATIEVSY